MRDILGQGGERAARPWAWRLVVAAAVVLVAAVVLIEHLPGHPSRPARPGPARAAAGPAPGSAESVPADEPDGISGQTLPWDASVRLPVTGRRPVWFWPATGRTRPIGGLPDDASGYLFIRVPGGWAVQPDPAVAAARPGCGSCAGAPQPVYFLSEPAPAATPVGLADDVAPGAATGTVWLTSYPTGADLGTAAGTAREVSVTGGAPGPQVRLPAGYVVVQGTRRGLLLAPATQHPGTAAYRLWDPAAPGVSRTFDGVIAASPGEIAWAPPCSPACRVQVLDLATGRRTAITLPQGSSAANGAFSPDGAFLALEVSFYNGGDAGALALQLDVASMSSGRLTAVPGTWVSSDALAGFGWPAAGDTLIAELSFTTKVQLASWRPGAARLAVAATKPGQAAGSLIVGYPP